MPRVVHTRDGDQRAQEPRVDASGGGAAGVEVQGEEADGEVEGFAGDLVAVDEAAPVPVDGDEAEGGGRARDFTPVGGVGLGVCGC